MCLYPPLAIIASLGFIDVNFKKINLSEILVGFIFIASLVVFFLPQDPKKARDFEIFEIRKSLDAKMLKPNSYVMESGAYSYWSLASLMSFLDGTTVYEVPSSNLKIDRANSLYLVKYTSENLFKSQCTLIYDLSKINSKAYFCP
jgi:hypothetical protein